MSAQLPFKISVLLFLRNRHGELLLIERLKHPNYGLWSGIGGKLEMDLGESPFAAAVREAREEAGIDLTPADLHLFGMISEKAYEGKTHWLMFLFDCAKPLNQLPPPIDEGRFAFHDPESIFDLKLPETDREALWPLYFRYRHGFTAMEADCTPGVDLDVTIHEMQLPAFPPPAGGNSPIRG